MLKILCVCGARPNFMKIAPLIEAMTRTGGIRPYLVHTGQHFDERLSQLFFDELSIPQPDLNLEVGSASHAVQTAEIMRSFEPVVLEQQPDWVAVVGDVNSTVACSLVACKLGIRVAHVEAGLRSGDRTMPEEINRLLTDSVSDLLFVTESSGLEHLRREGVQEEKIHFVGNVMIDTLLKNLARADGSRVLDELSISPKQYAVVTLHRPSNVNVAENLGSILDALAKIAEDMPIIFPMHPRTRKNVSLLGLGERIDSIAGMKAVEPLGYIDFLKLMAEASLVMTDSGGIQEETTILGVPCLTLRENTERPVTITEGTNRLVRPEYRSILAAYAECKASPPVSGRRPELWDGRAAERIAEIFVRAGN